MGARSSSSKHLPQVVQGLHQVQDSLRIAQCICRLTQHILQVVPLLHSSTSTRSTTPYVLQGALYHHLFKYLMICNSQVKDCNTAISQVSMFKSKANPARKDYLTCPHRHIFH